MRPFCPTRASSWNQTSKRSACGCSATICATAAGKPFFKALLRRGIGLGVPGPWRLPGQVQAAHQPRHPGLGIADAKPLPHDSAQIGQPPSGDAFHLWIRPRQHHGLQRRLLALRQAAGAATSPMVRQRSRARPVVADHPVAQRLTVYPHQSRRRLAAQTVQRSGDRQKAPGNPRVLLRPGQPPQILRRHIVPDPQPSRVPLQAAMLSDESQRAASEQHKSQNFARR